MNKEPNSDPRRTLAVLGGGGFVGARLTQLAALSGQFKTVPVLRSYRGLARLASVIGDACVTDTGSLEALSQALKGSHTVVNLTLGDQLRIVQDTQLIYAACLKAGVSQLIHVSSAAVFGRVEDPSISDDSPPDTHSWMLYAREKAKAEGWLGAQLNKKPMRVVVLRPGLIWGPGARWSEMVGDQLLHGKAVLSNGGKGIANLIFVGNLARVILAVASRPQGPSGFYNVADKETVTWEHYYAGLAKRLGYRPQAVCLMPDNRLRIGVNHAVEWALEQAPFYWVATRIWKRLGTGPKAVLKARLKGAPEPPRNQAEPGPPPKPSRGLWAVHNTLHQLPSTKVQRDFGPVELISFNEALDTTAAWLKFAGFSAPASVAKLSQAA